MNKQQPDALRLAAMLTADEWPGSVTLVSYARECVAELLRQHARITALESQLAQRFTAADMATAAAQGFRDGVASVAANAGSEPIAWLVCTEEGDPSMVFLDQREAQMFLEDDERPTPLYTHPSPTSAEVVEHG